MDAFQSLIVGAFGGAISSILTPFVKEIFIKPLEERREQNNIKSLARKDLQSQINLFCDQLGDRAVIIPLIKSFRKGLIEEVMKIRDFIRSPLIDLTEEKLENLRRMSAECLEIINKEPKDNDEEWSEKHGKDIESLCKRFRNLVSNL